MIIDLIRHAKQLLFDNSKNGMSATNVQSAIDELKRNFSKYLPLKGGTLADDLSIIANDQAQIYLECTGTNGKKGVFTAKPNAFGLYDSTHGKWVVSCGADGAVRLNGIANWADNATKASNATNAERASILYNPSDVATRPRSVGSNVKPVYFSDGVPVACGYDLSAMLLRSGGNMSGALNLANNIWNAVGDDAYFGDANVANCMCIKGKSGTGLALMATDQSMYCRVMTDATGTDLYLCVNGAVYVSNGNNDARAPIYASAFNQSSSNRVKENIIDISESDALKLLELRPVNYDYIGEETPKNCSGLIAEEVAKVLPNCVNGDVDCADDDEEAIKAIGIDYSKFVPYLIKLAQIQEKRIEELEKKIS